MIMTKEKMNSKEAYRCPICRHCLPVHDLVGEVIVYCPHCHNSAQVCLVPVKYPAYTTRSNTLDGAKTLPRVPIQNSVALKNEPYQIKIHEKHRYKCKDRVRLLDKPCNGRNYRIRINSDEIEIPYSKFLLLMFLLRELRKKKGGWVSGKTLEDENVTRDFSHTQRTIHDIRMKVKPYLVKDNEKEFIENDCRGNYRISIHPDFIAVPNKKWLSTQYNKLKKEVLKEREKRKEKWDKGT